MAKRKLAEGEEVDGKVGRDSDTNGLYRSRGSAKAGVGSWRGLHDGDALVIERNALCAELLDARLANLTAICGQNGRMEVSKTALWPTDGETRERENTYGGDAARRGEQSRACTASSGISARRGAATRGVCSRARAQRTAR